MIFVKIRKLIQAKYLVEFLSAGYCMTLIQIKSGSGRGGARMGPIGLMSGRSSSPIRKKFRALLGSK